MRETRLSGSEGGGARTRSPYPYRRGTFSVRSKQGLARDVGQASSLPVLWASCPKFLP